MNHSHRQLSGTLLLLSLLVACGGTGARRESAPARPSLRNGQMGSMNNVSVSGNIWMGSAPAPDDLDLAARRGIERVIDLRSSAEREVAGRATEEFVAACQELGLELLEVEVPEDLSATRNSTVDEVVSLLADHESRTLLLCRDGRRSAVFFALHRIVNEDVSVEDALVEARRCGMAPGEDEAFLLRQSQRLGPRSDS